MSHVRCHIFFFKVVQLVGEGLLSMGLTPSSFTYQEEFFLSHNFDCCPQYLPGASRNVANMFNSIYFTHKWFEL